MSLLPVSGRRSAVMSFANRHAFTICRTRFLISKVIGKSVTKGERARVNPVDPRIVQREIEQGVVVLDENRYCHDVYDRGNSSDYIPRPQA